MTERDSNVVEFINVYKLATREQIQRVFFKDVHPNVCMRRLTYLADNKYIKRDYYQIDEHTNAYVYFSKKKVAKRLIKHDLLITEFVIGMLSNNYDILQFQKSKRVGSVVSDAYVRYRRKDDSLVKHLVLEVQRSNKIEDCVLKYKNYRKEVLENEKEWNTLPKLVVISNLATDDNRIFLRGMRIIYDYENMKIIFENL